MTTTTPHSSGFSSPPVAAVGWNCWAFCLMPNHVHLLVRTQRDGDLGATMHWLLTVRVREHHTRYATDGSVSQGRFKSFVAKDDGHLLDVLRYVERNPLRAGLVDRAEDWPWGSFVLRVAGRRASGPLASPPVPLPDAWAALVNQREDRRLVDCVRCCVRRGRPYGDQGWTGATASRLGLESSLRPPGRPRRTDPSNPTSAQPALTWPVPVSGTRERRH